ncbi:MAG: 30S ribosomal protein S15 [Elusimicrobia bacterium]|nr:30S ribosomal protein S15 [Elusimicrobiota bacterium]MBI5597840.1 30S ribosomal protein S15 [Elusimicrobiota bacterium]
MTMTKTKKTEIVTKFGATPKDTGSAAVQIALITERIKQISEHMRTHRKDYATQVGLLRLVSQRRSLLAYVKKHDVSEYAKILKQLDLRK